MQNITAAQVPDSLRMDFLPLHFTPRFMMQAENLIYNWMGKLAPAYDGGYWEFYTLSNGGCYMAPRIAGKMQLSHPDNYFEGEMSADAAGIVASLYAICELANSLQSPRFSTMYHHLRDYALQHPEADQIMAAID